MDTLSLLKSSRIVELFPLKRMLNVLDTVLFLDDILISSETPELLIELVAKVIMRLAKVGDFWEKKLIKHVSVIFHKIGKYLLLRSWLNWENSPEK